MAKKKKASIATDIDTDSKAILFAHSAAAPSTAAQKDAIFRCIVAAFDKAGLTHISSMADQIVWQTIPPAVVDQLATEIRACVAQNVSDPGDLIGSFRILKAHNRVMSVGDLVAGISELL